MPVPVVVLAGGHSRRFGADKAEARFMGHRLIDHVVGRLRSQTDQIIISGPQEYGLGLDIIPDLPDAPPGPLGALWSVYAARPDWAAFVTVPVDMPRLPHDLVARLSVGGKTSIARAGGRLHPVVGHWTRAALADDFASDDLRRDPAMHHAARLAGAVVVDFEDRLAFANINTADDLARLAAALSPARP